MSKKAIKESLEFHDSEPPNAQHDGHSKDNGNSVGSDEVTVHLNPNKVNLDFLPFHQGHHFTKLSAVKNWWFL